MQCPETFLEESKITIEIILVRRINAVDAVQVKSESEDFEDYKFKEDKKALDDQGEVEGTNSFLFSLNTSYLNSSGLVLTFSTSQT